MKHYQILADVADVIMGQSPPGSTYNQSGEGLPFFQGTADFGYRFPNPRVYCTEPKRVAEPGDILLSIRAPIGRVNVANQTCAIGRGIAIIRPQNPEDTRYIEFVLRLLEPFWHTIEGSGSVFGNATKADLNQLPLPWPPSAERRAIAHILGTLDDKIELLRRMSETLEAMARAIFKAWFVDFVPVRAKMEGRWKRGQSLPGLPAHLYDLFPDRLVPSELGEIPEGWRVGTLAEISYKPQYGYTATAQEMPVSPKFLRIKDINKLPWIDWASVPYCKIPDAKIEQYRLHTGDVLIARMADPGHGVMIEGKTNAVFASYLIRFRLKNLSYARYIQYWLRSRPYWELVQARLTGTTRPNLNARVIGAFPLIIPEEKVVSTFGAIVNPLRQQVTRNVEETNILIVLRDTLLPKLIRGEIRVKGMD